MKRNQVFLAVFFFVLGAATLVGGQKPAEEHPMMGQKSQPAISAPCQSMMVQNQEMVTKLKQMDEDLQAKLKVMNNAQGQQKVDVMAAVLNEMVSQRKQMRESMMAGHQHMMGPMMGHMQMGISGEGEPAMEDCPMMKEMMSGTGSNQ